MSLSADTGLIHDYAAACAAHASQLQRAASHLATAGAGADAMFGPVGARFAASLLRAVSADACAIIRLSDSIAAGTAAASATVTAYRRADDDAADHITGIHR